MVMVRPPEANILDGEILRVTIGSEVHGVSVNADDHDEMGILVPSSEYVLGLSRWPDRSGVHGFDQYRWRTQPEGVRSGPGDIDLVVYGLHKWMSLAVKGNPSIILPLYVPDDFVIHGDPLGRKLRDIRWAIVNQSIRDSYAGYVQQQRDQLLGLRGGRHTNRPELVEKYGFDTKFAYHMVRVAFQGAGLWTTGEIPVPVPEPMRSMLVDLRHGERSLQWALETAEEYETTLRESDPALPEHSDLGVIHDFMTEAFFTRWFRND